MLLDYLIEDNGLDIDTADVQFIKDLIQGVPSASKEKHFLFDIVANKRNSVDVDKFDYIQRDCHNVGIKSSYDCTRYGLSTSSKDPYDICDRLIWFSRVIDDQICYSDKEVFNLYEMFHTRYSLFKRVYTHRVGKAIELMIVDALLLADPYLHLSEAIDSPEEYSNLTDSVLREIEKSKVPVRSWIFYCRIDAFRNYNLLETSFTGFASASCTNLWNSIASLKLLCHL
jgi:HD superfamily phosphohydrolase